MIIVVFMRVVRLWYFIINYFLIREFFNFLEFFMKSIDNPDYFHYINS